ncbi:MAG: hypothetical protein Q7S09_02715 [bacterium]|nr:hypothetical protein [bacterium]
MTNQPLPNRPGATPHMPRTDTFSRNAGRLSRQQMDEHISRMPMFQHDQEYIKQVMGKFDIAGYSQGITREEFHKGLDEMAKNTRDPIDLQKIERIKTHFN